MYEHCGYIFRCRILCIFSSLFVSTSYGEKYFQNTIEATTRLLMQAESEQTLRHMLQYSVSSPERHNKFVASNIWQSRRDCTVKSVTNL